MIYQPITDAKKAEWVKWLKDQQRVVNGQQEDASKNDIFKTPEGDVATGKDLIGNFLATLTGEPVTIN